MGDSWEGIFHKQFLLGRGFTFELMTHLREFEGLNRFAIYNYMIIPSGDDKIRVVRYD